MGDVHSFKVMTSSKKIEWYTPLDVLEEVDRFFGGIDLDPARPDADDGLVQTWRGKVFLNPPYGRHIKKWIDKALSDPVDEIILLVPSSTSAPWFQPLFRHAVCFVRGRLKFRDPEGIKPAGAPFASVLAYRGPRPEAFEQAFSHRGHVVIGKTKEPTAYQLPLSFAA